MKTRFKLDQSHGRRTQRRFSTFSRSKAKCDRHGKSQRQQEHLLANFRKFLMRCHLMAPFKALWHVGDRTIQRVSARVSFRGPSVAAEPTDLLRAPPTRNKSPSYTESASFSPNKSCCKTP